MVSGPEMPNSGPDLLNNARTLVAKDPRQRHWNMLRFHRQVSVTDATRDKLDQYFSGAGVSDITR
jgi:hypothetical protein